MANQELVVAERQDAMLSLIERAVMSPELDVNKLKELLTLRERYEATEARKAFVEAMKHFKEAPPTIERTKDGPKLGGGNKPAYMYAPLDKVCDALIPALGAVGITHRWETAYEGEWMIVNCVLTHELGHSERTSMRGCDDKGPGRNAIQASASTLTYLERYTLLAACGIAVRGTDTDGVDLSAAAAEDVQKIKAAPTRDELKKIYDAAYVKFKDNPAARGLVIEAKEKRKGELLNA